jgi:hypothetical protein
VAALDPITAVLNVGNSLIDRLIPDKAQNDAAKASLLQMQVKGDLDQISGQLEVNKVEAASNSVFVAGWRPYIGWICGTALAEDMIVRPMLQQISTLLRHPVVLQPLDISTLLTLLGGLLGFGAMRSYDKNQGTDNGH